MKTYCANNLKEIKNLLQQLNNEQYIFESKALFGATIGQHVRHIIEFYQAVFNGLESKNINYDLRERNFLIETNIEFSIEIVNEVLNLLSEEQTDQNMFIEGNFCSKENKLIQIKTSLQRELAYCLEHSIHHQALIKVGLLELDCLALIDHTFGLAPATIHHRRLVTQ